jgi:DNA-binding NarL/FixJ family response regulator
MVKEECRVITTSMTTRLSGKSKILIVDDHPIIRQGLARMINQEPDLTAREGADNVADAFAQVREQRPDLVLVDVSLKDSHGIELIAQIKEFDEGIKMLVWSAFDEKTFAERAVRAGAMGYVSKEEPYQNVLEAIRRVLDGNMYLSPGMTNKILRRLGGGEVNHDPIDTLSNREIEVFQMLGRGMTTKAIAKKLGVSPKTIEAHRERIKIKLNLKNASELNCQAVQWVLQNGQSSPLA